MGTVSDTGELYPANSGGPTVAASFQAIDDAGNPVTIAGTVTSVTLSAEGDPSLSPACRRRPRRSLPTRCSTPRTRRRVAVTPAASSSARSSRPGIGVDHQLQPLQLAADHGGPVRRVQLRRHPDGRHPPGRHGVRRSRRPGPHRLRGPDRPGDVRDRRLHRPERRRVHAPHPHQPRRGTARGAAGRGPTGPRLLVMAGTWWCGVAGTGLSPDDDRRRADGGAPKDRAERPGPSGVRRARVLGRRLACWSPSLGWGIHGLVAKPGAQHGGPPVVAPQAAARPPGRPDRRRARWPIRPSRRGRRRRGRRHRPSRRWRWSTARWCPAKGCPYPAAVHHLHVDDLAQPRARHRAHQRGRLRLHRPSRRRSTSRSWCPDSRPCPPRCTPARA